MEIIFTDKDKEFVEMLKNEDKKNVAPYINIIPYLNPKSKMCSLELEINDPYKCGVFLSELCISLKEHTEEELGFHVKTISLQGISNTNDKKIEELKNDIRKILKNY